VSCSNAGSMRETPRSTKQPLGIIVEGVDCSGKTTLIREVKSHLSRFGWDALDSSHRSGPQFERYFDLYVNAERVIFDRAHFSEVVFGDLWRSGNHFLPSQREWLDRFAFQNMIVVWCTAPAEVLERRYAEREILQTIDKTELKETQERFGRIFSDSGAIVYESVSEEALHRMAHDIVNTVTSGVPMQVKEPSQKPTDRLWGIIVEGANGSGKSTFVKRLKVAMMGWCSKTLDYQPTNPYLRFLQEYSRNRLCIFDRAHYSEIVYGNLFRSGNHFTAAELETLDTLVRQHMRVVLCETSPGLLIERHRALKYPKHIHESRLQEVTEEFRRVIPSDIVTVVDTSSELDLKRAIDKLSLECEGIPYEKMGWGDPKATRE